MVDIDEYECPQDGCEYAYPHPLLVEAHMVFDHGEELDAVIEGRSSPSFER